MSHYKSNVRDQEFNLFEVLGVDKALGKGKFADLDVDTAREMLNEMARLAEGPVAASFAEGDRNPPVFDPETHSVALPESFKGSVRAIIDNGWDKVGADEVIGGTPVPRSLQWAMVEHILGANPAVYMYAMGTGLANIFYNNGTDEQKKWAVICSERNWGATMVLTEPDAGSDVGAGRTKARHVGGDVWELEGVKRFITNGDFDAAENIIHLVLARPEGAGPGTKGLSMFIVPKFWVNEDGSLGERNGVYCTNIEHKMGIKASATCEMTFGERHPARGLLVGEVHDGIRQMFHVIEHARMAVGCKSMATLSTAYLNALDYAKIRVQGPDLARANDKAAPRARIIEHPDVRRMLMTQKCFAEGMRALCLYTASIQDAIELAGGHGSAATGELDKLNDLLLPLVKGYCSEKVYELLSLSLQTYGGSGYCQDYPIEQYIRDQKIDTLYEGTTHIQALDLFFRKVMRDMGATLRGLLEQVEATVKSIDPSGPLAVEQAALGKALADLQGIYMAMIGKAQESVYHVGFQGNRILFATAEVVIGWLLLKQGIVAAAKRETASERDRDFYQGKLAAIRFYARNVLPGVTLTRKLVEQGTLELMDVPESAF